MQLIQWFLLGQKGLLSFQLHRLILPSSQLHGPQLGGWCGGEVFNQSIQNGSQNLEVKHDFWI